MEVIWIIPLRSEPDNFKPQDVRMIREYKRGHFAVVCVSNVECVGFGDNNPVSPVKHFLSGTVMPGLYNPILGYVYTLSLVGKRIVP